jgi:hypothetical protein
VFDRLRIWARLRLEDYRTRVRRAKRRRLRKLAEVVLTDFDLMGGLLDLTSSAAFEREHLTRTPYFKSRTHLFRHALGQVAGDEGLFLEFGVYKGDSINRLAELRPAARWYGFDSFIGLPEMWNVGARAGAFDVGGRLPPVRSNVTLVKGFYEQTLAPFVAQHRRSKVAFMHIDCDLYSATRTVFAELSDLLQPGCVVVFDEFFNYSGWQDGEYKAFTEFLAAKGRSFDYVGYVRHSCQVAVRLI